MAEAAIIYDPADATAPFYRLTLTDTAAAALVALAIPGTLSTSYERSPLTPIVGTVTVSTERLVSHKVVPVPAVTGLISSSPAWSAPIDPGDRVLFGIDWTDLIGGDHLVAIQVASVSAAAAALGVAIDIDDRRPILDTTNSRVGLWIKTDSVDASLPAFSSEGVFVGITVRVTTDAVPPKVDERTAALKVRQL